MLDGAVALAEDVVGDARWEGGVGLKGAPKAVEEVLPYAHEGQLLGAQQLPVFHELLEDLPPLVEEDEPAMRSKSTTR